MDGTYLLYFLLGGALCFGARICRRGEWNEEYTSLGQMKVLQGISILGVALHHMAQKTCAPWHPRVYTVHGLDVFLPLGYLFVAVFLFCSGYGLFRSLKTKPDYLRGFLRRRVMPIAIAFWLSEIIYLLVRWAMGEKLTAVDVITYLPGLKLANFNAWYMVAILGLYLVFFLAFRRCRSDRSAIILVTLFTLLYTLAGACVGHSDWWFCGEWWYNSIIMFPLGMVFARHEARITARLKKGYPFWLILSLAAAVITFYMADYAVNSLWGYYGPAGDPLTIPRRLGSAAAQWLSCAAFVACCLIVMLKVRSGNRLWTLLGGVTLEFYLMHGLFVELFGYDWLDTARSLVYIKNVPLYTLAVLACSALATALFSVLWKRCVCLICKTAPAEKPKKPVRRIHIPKKLKKWTVPGLTALALVGIYFALGIGQDNANRGINGMQLTMPDGYVCTLRDGSYSIWKYTGTSLRPGNVVLDPDVHDWNVDAYASAEDVLERCGWLRDSELYVNQYGVRMARGFVIGADSIPERRYYVEGKTGIFMLFMIENSRFFDTADCEEVMQQIADSVREKQR